MLLAVTSLWDNAAVPEVIDSGDPDAVEVGVRFRSDVAGDVTGIRFYKSDANTGTHTGSLWTADGTLLGSVQFSSETASGWQVAMFDNAIAIDPDTTYIASYHTTSGHYSFSANYFSGGPYEPEGTPLYALRDGADGGNGLFRYTATSAFPNQSFTSANYWVDVVFDGQADLTSPQITSVSPGDGSSNIDASAEVRVAFTERMDPDSINGDTLRLLQNGTPVPATVSYDTTSRTAVLDPVAGLENGTTYTVLVEGGAGAAVADRAGNALAADFTSSFTTAPFDYHTIWSNDTVPTITAFDDPTSLELGVKFRADVDGLIHGVRFYKGEGNGGTHVGNLWTVDGTNLASAIFTNETSTGWQSVFFSEPVTITAGTTYVASYFAPEGHYAVDAGYFQSPVINPPLEALADGTDGGNGIFLETPVSAFPGSSFNSNNYWVDVIFTDEPIGPVDTTAPTVVSTDPADGEADVSLTTNVTVTFDEELDPASVHSGTIRLQDTDGNIVDAAVSYDASTLQAVVTPSAPLEESTSYTIRVDGVTDLTGNALTGFTATFTTLMATPPTQPVELRSDPLHPGRSYLAIDGTDAGDVILVAPANYNYANCDFNTDDATSNTAATKTVKVWLNGVSYGVFSDVSRIVARGEGGSDIIWITSAVDIPAYLFGGDGSDVLKLGRSGGAASAGNGSDLILGGRGRDLLIGGRGADLLYGSSGDDVLVSGFTSHDDSDEALHALVREWSRNDVSYSGRISHLTGASGGGLNGSVFLKTDGSQQSVFDDGVTDLLVGGNNSDWFLYNTGSGGGAIDLALRSSGETGSDTDAD